MRSWIVILLVVFLGPVALRWWARRRARANLMSLPLFATSFAEAAAEAVPPAIRDGLTAAAAELTALGFEPIGYFQSPEFGVARPRFYAVLHHPAARAFAVVAFPAAESRGAVVDFETMFEDGRWLRTVNRRGQYFRPDYITGRVDDALAASVADQWRFHQEAVGREAARRPRGSSLGELIAHLNAVDAEDSDLNDRQGDVTGPDETGLRHFTRQRADRFIERIQAGTRRLAAAPPPTGIFLMRIPVEDIERRYQNLLFILSRQPRSRGVRAFLLSALTFAVSMLLFTSWAWLLWVIPVILLHEIGHWVAMRAFGHRDARIRFIPFFGAATITEKRFERSWHEMVVLLAGPLPGLLLGFVLLQLAEFGRSPFSVGVAIVLIAINGLNLLPLHPLDGGKILRALVTAGRPWLDIALKMAASGLFVAGAIAWKDPTLAVLGGLGFLLFRSELRTTRVDAGIRARPDFGPHLTAEQRRALIFDALSDHPKSDGLVWVREVQQLEASLGHVKPRWWQAAPWALAYVACFGGLVAWSASVLTLSSRLGSGGCPTSALAQRAACGGDQAADIDWTRVDRQSLGRNPFKLASRPDHAVAAFVWCAGKGDAVEKAAVRMHELQAFAKYCPAFPWELLPADVAQVRDKARWTVRTLAVTAWLHDPPGLLERIDQLTARVRTSPWFDAEAARLYRRSHESAADPAADRQLSERLGRSPTESCKRLQILSAEDQHDREAKPGAGEDRPEQEGEQDDDEDPPFSGIRLSVGMAAPEDFAPLRDYLCGLGCAVRVLPYGAADPRLRRCF